MCVISNVYSLDFIKITDNKSIFYLFFASEVDSCKSIVDNFLIIFVIYNTLEWDIF